MKEQAHHRREDAVVTLAGELLRSHGEFRFVAWGSSMVPSVFPGDTLIVRRVTPEGICSGDVVLFARAGRFYAHRLVNKTDEGAAIHLIARGDSHNASDPPYAEHEMLGRAEAVIRRGKRIELEGYPAIQQRLLQSIVRRSTSALKWLLRWHFFRVRLAQSWGAARSETRWQSLESA
jgi:Peptidase S24-like